MTLTLESLSRWTRADCEKIGKSLDHEIEQVLEPLKEPPPSLENLQRLALLVGWRIEVDRRAVEWIVTQGDDPTRYESAAHQRFEQLSRHLDVLSELPLNEDSPQRSIKTLCICVAMGIEVDRIAAHGFGFDDAGNAVMRLGKAVQKAQYEDED